MLEDNTFLEQSLLEDEMISPSQLRAARELMSEMACPLSEALITINAIDSRTLALAKATICESPFVDVDIFEIDFENAQLLPKEFAESHLVFPLFNIGGVVTLGTDDPLDSSMMDQVRQILKCEIDAVQCEASPLRSLIARAYSMGRGLRKTSDDGLVTETAAGPGEIEQAGPIVEAVNSILEDAVRCGASDVHLNPDQSTLHIRFRVDGRLQSRQGPTLTMHPKIVQRLKVMAQLDLTQSRRPQDGKFRFSFGGDPYDVRMSVVPTVDGENVVLRLLSGQGRIANYTEMGMTSDIASQLSTIAKQPYGIFLVTGPTGSGKTTTLYSVLNRLNSSDSNLITIEDPVEIRMPMVRQIQINHEIDMTFARALRSVLRQDPDVILVGEIRDEETAGIAMQAALTGHFVLSTVHTNDAAGAVARLHDLGQAPFVVSSALLGVMSQRLVRRICSSCACEAAVDDANWERLRLQHDAKVREGSGCSQCLHTGYQGRIGLFELLDATTEVKEAIEREASTDEINRTAIASGMRLMWQDGVDKVRQGLTTVNEVVRTVSTRSLALVDSNVTAATPKCSTDSVIGEQAA